MPRNLPRPGVLADGAVVTKAALRAADRLALSNRALARILGVSEATVSRMGAGSYVLSVDDKAFEIALLFVRLFRSLDAIVAGDDGSARAWMTRENAVLGQPPAAMIQSLAGLVNVVGYLDSRRALL